MVKFLCFLLILYFSNCRDSNEICNLNKKAESLKECENLELGVGIYRCCFEEWKYKKDGVTYESKNCFPVSKDFYDRIADILEEHDETLEKDGCIIIKSSIDCSSYELKNSLVYLLSLILLYL